MYAACIPYGGLICIVKLQFDSPPESTHGRRMRGASLQVSPPKVNKEGPLQVLVTNLDYDEHKGRIAIGRVTSGKISRAETVLIGRPGESRPPLHASLTERLHTPSAQGLVWVCVNRKQSIIWSASSEVLTDLPGL